MKRFQWTWISTGSKTCCSIWRPFWFAIVAILNPQWPPKYKNPPIWSKFGFQVDFVLANWYPSSFLELGAILWSFRSYHYITPTAVGWCIAILRFFFTIIIIIILIILPHIFVRSISRRCVNQALWNLVGISYAMWSCAFKCWFFQNGCRCHGNGQNAKKLKNTKIIIAGYSSNRNWWNLIGTTSTSSGTR